MRISDGSSDVCSSDLKYCCAKGEAAPHDAGRAAGRSLRAGSFRGRRMDFDAWRSLTAAFVEQVSRRRDAPFLWHKQDGRYRSQSWGEIARQVGEISRGLRNLGLQPGDRVVLVAENRPEWLVADLAIMAAGGITVPAYTTALTKIGRAHV